MSACVKPMAPRGLAGEAPFDVIVLSGSVSSVPQALLQQLKVGGRLIGTVGGEPVMRAVRITRIADAQFTEVDLFDTVLPRLSGFGGAQPLRFLSPSAHEATERHRN